MKPMIALALVALVCLVAAPVANADSPIDPVVALLGTCITVSPGHVPPAWIDPNSCLDGL